MTWWEITLIVVAVFLIANILIMLIVAPHVIFYHTVYRNPKKKRTRECTNLKDDDQVKMFEEGIAWAEKYRDKITSLEIINDGLSLKGEYIDFGSEKCAIILQGRTESLLYSYYFAEPYAEKGYNILVVDLRAHGLSDGKYQTGGIKESEDIVAWVNYIEKHFHIKQFLFHGICIGAATAIYATLSLQGDSKIVVERIITDGLYATYFEIFKQNFASYKKKPFPMLYLTFFLARLYTGVNFFKNKPIEVVSKIKCPILLIYSEEDSFCPRESSEKIFARCTNQASELVFFPYGRHSHVRSNNKETYDAKIKEFISR